MSQSDTSPDIRSLLHKAELDAERIVSLARMAVSLGLLLFFAVAIPAVADTEDPLLVRQSYLAIATILGYLSVALFSWLMLQRNRFRKWMIWFVSLADVLFVIASIWSGMDNLQLTGDTMFVFPAVWLIPLVLSFGVLRGNPRVLGSTVVLMSVGLLALVGYQTGSAKGQTDDSIWLLLALPPNIMRFIMIALAGIVLIAATTRTRALLHRSIDATERNANLTRYLPAKLAPQLAAGQLGTLRQGRREEIAVLFIDIRGFTRMSESMSPQDVSDFVTRFRHIVSGVAESHGGMIDKFMGDAAMILFSEPDDPAQAARNGLACARALNRAMQDWSERRCRRGIGPVQAGIGLHFGSVFSGVVGDETRLEYTVFGDAVNVAARLQEMTRQLMVPVLASQETVQAAGSSDWVQVADTALRGRSDDTVILRPAGLDAQQWLQ